MNPLATIGIILLAAGVLFMLVLLLYSRVRPHLYKSDGTDLSAAEGKTEFIVPTEGTPYLIKRKADGSISDESFKILTAADLHLSTEASELTFKLLAEFLDREKPDLVILLGDNVVGHADIVMQEKIKAFFEERGQYWGFVLGNHDSEYKIKADIESAEKTGALSAEEKQEIDDAGRKWMFDSLAYGAHCVVTCGEESVHGSGNCVVNVRNSKGIIQSLFFIDSGDYVYGIKRKGIGSEKRCYDYIRKNQIEWYKRRLVEISAENDGITPKSIAFFHIPLPEFRDAFRAWRLHKKSVRHYFGNNYEKTCASDVNAGAFAAFSGSGSTHIVVCGHDHKNDSSIEYKGVRLTYSQGLQYDGAYNRRKRARFLKLLNNIDDRLCCFTEGVSLFMVNADGSVHVAAKYAQKEELYDGPEKYYDRAFLTGTVKAKKPIDKAERKI